MDRDELERLGARLHDGSRLLGARRRRIAAERLAADGSAAAIALLTQALADGGDAPIVAIARATLDGLTDEQQDVIDAVCGEWARTRSAALGESIGERGWVASEPAGLMVLTALQADRARRPRGVAGADRRVGPLARAPRDRRHRGRRAHAGHGRARHRDRGLSPPPA